MRLTVLSAALAGVVLLGACHRSVDGIPGHGGHPGRYASVGLYAPDKQWTRLIADQAAGAQDPKAAHPIDDQVILVTQDSVTGEIRACGDLTGYCIGMNPWRGPLSGAQQAPIRLSAHVEPDRPDAAAVTAPTAKPSAQDAR